MTVIHRSQISKKTWIDTSFIRLDEKEEFRERPQFGNRHAIFSKNSNWGSVHVDNHNAIDFPTGTLDHLSTYTEEKTGIPEQIAKAGIIIAAVIIGAAAIKYVGGKIDEL